MMKCIDSWRVVSEKIKRGGVCSFWRREYFSEHFQVYSSVNLSTKLAIFSPLNGICLYFCYLKLFYTLLKKLFDFLSLGFFTVPFSEERKNESNWEMKSYTLVKS